jgi:hypothetical protein
VACRYNCCSSKPQDSIVLVASVVTPLQIDTSCCTCSGKVTTLVEALLYKRGWHFCGFSNAHVLFTRATWIDWWSLWNKKNVIDIISRISRILQKNYFKNAILYTKFMKSKLNKWKKLFVSKTKMSFVGYSTKPVRKNIDNNLATKCALKKWFQNNRILSHKI